MRTTVVSVLILAAAAAIPATSFAKGANAPDSASISKQYTTWNEALQTGDPEKVAALYCDPGGILIPTMSNTIRTTHAEIVDYFRRFLKLKPQGTIDKAYIRQLGTDVAINTGVYTFNLTKNGKAKTIQAHYTFVYWKQHGKWCIMEQQSSLTHNRSSAAKTKPKSGMPR